MLQWMCLPLIDNSDGEYRYDLYVYTGKSSLESGKVHFILGGAFGDTGCRLMSDGLRKVNSIKLAKLYVKLPVRNNNRIANPSILD